MTAILDNENHKTIVCTSTYEPFMSVRLYYKLHSQELLIEALNELKSVEFISNNAKFIVSYCKEEQRKDFFTFNSKIFEKLFKIDLTTINLGCGSIRGHAVKRIISLYLGIVFS
ncbi:hypothetical protein [Rickettsia endosymbiont of Ceutorhynchus obstrictus]|uniref:hypothetical protein n=1 Tax=Rickettsia endosymbiont of Ceutorhynchus obstrictus TaxID=3066249 RepID=UPI0031332CAD